LIKQLAELCAIPSFYLATHNLQVPISMFVHETSLHLAQEAKLSMPDFIALQLDSEDISLYRNGKEN
jgi:hypothetical protein